MSQFNKAMITEQGLALVQKIQQQGYALKFTQIQTGDGMLSEGEKLENLESLKGLKQSFPISSLNVVDSKTIKLTAIISNDDLEAGYYIKEIGIFAEDPDKGEILYSISVAVQDKWDYLPARDTPETITVQTYCSVSNTENVTIKIQPGAYASADELKAVDDRVVGLEEKVKDGFEEITEAEINEIWAAAGGSGGGGGDIGPIETTRLLPGGGLAGQVLTKVSETNYDVGWNEVDANIEMTLENALNEISEEQINDLF